MTTYESEVTKAITARIETELRPAIEAAADKAIDILIESDVIRVHLTPGDGTLYDLILARPAMIDESGSLMPNRGRVWVTVVNLGRRPRTAEIESYVVEGRGGVDPGWVARELADGEYTAHVLAVFLTAVFGKAQ